MGWRNSQGSLTWTNTAQSYWTHPVTPPMDPLQLEDPGGSRRIPKDCEGSRKILTPHNKFLWEVNWGCQLSFRNLLCGSRIPKNNHCTQQSTYMYVVSPPTDPLHFRGSCWIPEDPEGSRRIRRIPENPGGSQRIPKNPGGSGGSQRILEDPEGSRRIPKDPEGSQRIRRIPENPGGSRRIPKDKNPLFCYSSKTHFRQKATWSIKQSLQSQYHIPQDVFKTNFRGLKITGVR